MKKRKITFEVTTSPKHLNSGHVNIGRKNACKREFKTFIKPTGSLCMLVRWYAGRTEFLFRMNQKYAYTLKILRPRWIWP